MPKIDTHKFYTSAIEKFGISPKGVNWASKENQVLRFTILLELLPKDLSNVTLCDAGCGFGDFYHYLEKKKKLPSRYIGIDSLLEMTSIALQNTAQEILNANICKDSLPNADYYVCSGALNVLTDFEIILFIQNCYRSSKKAFFFNALFGNKQSETYNYLTKEKIEKIAEDLDVKEVVLRDDYMQDDITVGFFR